MLKPSRTEPFYFTEAELPYGRTGVQLSTLVTDVLHKELSGFGKVEVLDTSFYGRMLVIDGIIQTTTSDEFIYHEMMVLLPTLRLPAARRILIIGGGDGGAIKQALRIKGVEQVVLVEIDRTVVDLSRKYLPELSSGAFDDPLVELVIADGRDYILAHPNEFDLVVLDLTDPTEGGPAEALYTSEFYAEAKAALRSGGVLSLHCGSLTFQPREAKTVIDRLRPHFQTVALHTAVVPSYQLSTFGFIQATDNYVPSAAELNRRFTRFTSAPSAISPEIFGASQVLAPYLKAETGLI